MNYFNRNTSKNLITITIVVLYLCYSTTEAKPSKGLVMTGNVDLETPVDPSLYNGDLSPHIIRQIQKCDADLQTMELCMRCAKVTKSEIVYPMCCDNEDGVKDWCHDYIFFGATPNSS